MLSDPAKLVLTERELHLLLQSKQACAAAVRDTYDDTRIARSINGEIVTDSESDNPLDYVGVRCSQ